MLNFNKADLEELMRSFYHISGIRLVLFDSDFKKLIAYPEADCDFCRLLKSNLKTKRRCAYADKRSFEKSKQANGLIIYKCHAGLVEAVTPMHENGETIGYLMLGQITDCADRRVLSETIINRTAGCNFSVSEIEKRLKSVKHKSEDEIAAAAKIMEACTGYILFKELIRAKNSRLIEEAKQLLEDNLSSELDIAALCDKLSIGRTKLYEIFKAETGMGVAAYFNRRRLHRAKKLLKTTEMSVASIADAVGFSDYNYFSRVFKKQYGKSPRFYRKKY